ncbi:hypothetical protein ACFOWE_11795 [Planomonospora corallina]|uniref:Voltage-gated potassium channel n=1 Tax=Planomonospora corallina TaxID=1806052 RepID=A0ABV8I4Q6_9ACTN
MSPRIHETAAVRQTRAERLIDRLDAPMSVLGLLFLLVVLGQNLASHPVLADVFFAAGWLLWAAFAAEYALRLYVAPARLRFLRRTWWQLIFLLVPFLRFLRLLRLVRLARAGGVLGSAVRGSRSAGRLLSGRLTWLAALSAIIVLASSQVLHEFAGYDDYALALHDAALATVTGEPLTVRTTALAAVVEVLLAVYSVVVFASVAAAMGAYFLSHHPSTPHDGEHPGGERSGDTARS